MNRPPRPWIGLLGLAAAVAGCDYGVEHTSRAPTKGIRTNPIEAQVTGKRVRATAGRADGPRDAAKGEETRKALLDSVVRLLEDAPTNPGGRNFDIAVQNLNQYFSETPDSEFALGPDAQSYLSSRLNPQLIKQAQEREFVLRDARHIEDCLLYHAIATRVAGQGEDLERVRRVFDWVVRQIQLVPAGSLSRPPLPNGGPALPQAEARPFDVLLRGMATEGPGQWSERGWLFASLCRQLGVDVGLLAYRPPTAAPGQILPWVCVAAIGDRAYLFDQRIGLPIPGPDGTGVATVEQAATDPQVLGQLDLPGQSEYRTRPEDLAEGLVVLMDSSLGYLEPKMKLLQDRLAGRNRMILYRDPAAQRDRFASALGPRFGSASPWPLTLEVEQRLFSNPQFVDASQYAILFFDSKWPLLPARMAQLRGDFEKAADEYTGFRFNEAALARDKKTPIPPPIRRALDMYATYFLALGHLDQGRPEDAEFLFRETLRLLPDPGAAQPYYNMFRWGALTNLGRIAEARGEDGRAIAYYCAPVPTADAHGSLLRARELVWRDPTAPPPEPLPPAPREQVNPAAPRSAATRANPAG